MTIVCKTVGELRQALKSSELSDDAPLEYGVVTLLESRSPAGSSLRISITSTEAIGDGPRQARPPVNIFTDGACKGNPGPGGWGALVIIDDQQSELCGGESHTTNNRMELLAPIEALRSLPDGAQVSITTDSQYVRNGITQWIAGWKRRGWKTASGEAVKNVDLWKELDAQCRRHAVAWHWVKGHSGHPENERADVLANRGLSQARARSSIT